MDSDPSFNTYIRKERHLEAKQRQLNLDSFDEDMATTDAQYVFNVLHDEFRQSKEAWAKPPPAIKYKVKLPSLVSPLKKLSQSTVIIFFPGKLPSANDVAQWVQSLLGGYYRCLFHFEGLL